MIIIFTNVIKKTKLIKNVARKIRVHLLCSQTSATKIR